VDVSSLGLGKGRRGKIPPAAVYAPVGFGLRERIALDGLTEIRGHGGHDIQLIHLGVGQPKDFGGLDVSGGEASSPGRILELGLSPASLLPNAHGGNYAAQLKQTISSLRTIISSRRSPMAILTSKTSVTDKGRQRAVDEFVRRASQAYGDRIKSITLFGSVAKGTTRSDSDIDLLVVVDREDFRLRRELISLAFDILLETGGDLSVKVLSSRDFEARRSFSFLRNVLSEGVRIA
jgi:predicted nucleotidyltransferase